MGVHFSGFLSLIELCFIHTHTHPSHRKSAPTSSSNQSSVTYHKRRKEFADGTGRRVLLLHSVQPRLHPLHRPLERGEVQRTPIDAAVQLLQVLGA